MPKKKTKKKTSTSRMSLRKVVLFSSFVWVFGGVLLIMLIHKPCANSISCVKDLSGAYDSQDTIAEFMGEELSVPTRLADSVSSAHVLGVSNAAKKIYVDLSAQRLYAKEGDTIVYDFPVSSGKWYPTPTGVFSIWIKLRYTRMTGGNKAIGTYYNLPNVPYTMYFYNDEFPKYLGYGLHGAYWHNNFGHPMSHGCINIRPEDAGQLYAWANPLTHGYTTFASAENPGTQVIIYGETPKE